MAANISSLDVRTQGFLRMVTKKMEGIQHEVEGYKGRKMPDEMRVILKENIQFLKDSLECNASRMLSISSGGYNEGLLEKVGGQLKVWYECLNELSLAGALDACRLNSDDEDVSAAKRRR